MNEDSNDTFLESLADRIADRIADRLFARFDGTKPTYLVEEQTLRDGKRLLSMTEAAEQLSMSRSSVYQLAYGGGLKTVKIGRRRLVAPEDLRAFVAENTGRG